MTPRPGWQTVTPDVAPDVESGTSWPGTSPEARTVTSPNRPLTPNSGSPQAGPPASTHFHRSPDPADTVPRTLPRPPPRLPSRNPRTGRALPAVGAPALVREGFAHTGQMALQRAPVK